MENQEIMHLWDTHVGQPDEKYPLTEGDILRFVGVILSRAIPEGHVVVPKEPTKEMVEKGWRSTGDSLNGRPVWKLSADTQAAHIYSAMISAAPAPEGEA